ncbi:MAG TPA: phosphate ABC transporter permease PstA [Fimbriimonadaceae bacterium]|nr:phosphate ABC transporter permease PstA [Fimbriimonadaceae bacterium]
MIRALLIGGVAIVVIYTILILVLPWESRRRVRHLATYALGVCCTIVALIPLVMLVTYLVKAGAPGLGADFFTQVQKPIGEPGSGMKHAIIGSLIIVSLASAIGVPIGILCGIYLAEVGKGKFAAAIRFLSEVMTGLPSIIAGILGFALIVARYERFSAWAGALALSILMIPVVTRVTEEAIRLVPKALREASFGLGAQRWQTVVKVVLPSARSAILTGVILAVARVGGETAPLLFTAAGQSLVNTDPSRAMAALPLSIYLNANQPFDTSKQLAISGALFLVIWIAFVNFVIRWIAAKTQPRLS